MLDFDTMECSSRKMEEQTCFHTYGRPEGLKNLIMILYAARKGLEDDSWGEGESAQQSW